MNKGNKLEISFFWILATLSGLALSCFLLHLISSLPFLSSSMGELGDACYSLVDIIGYVIAFFCVIYLFIILFQMKKHQDVLSQLKKMTPIYIPLFTFLIFGLLDENRESHPASESILIGIVTGVLSSYIVMLFQRKDEI